MLAVAIYAYSIFTASHTTLREMGNGLCTNVYVQRLRQMIIKVHKVYHNIGPVCMENHNPDCFCFSSHSRHV